MRVFLSFMSAFLFLSQAQALEAIDVYGVDDKTAQMIVDENRQIIMQYAALMKAAGDIPLNDHGMALYKRHEAIKRKINQKGLFVYVGLSIVLYPGGAEFATIDLVPESERHRMPSSPQRKIKKNMEIKPQVKQLIALWREYESRGIKQFVMNPKKVSSSKKSCPALHCLFDFDAKALIQYYQPFYNGAKQYQRELLDIIAYSPDNVMRGQAIFVLANSQNVKFITQMMSRYIDDKSGLIRNNAMRVLANIALYHDAQFIPMKKIIEALDYPELTDRNKAQVILMAIARKNPSTHAFIKRHAAQTLVKLIKLQQPNNHDSAYQILKIISHKSYSDKNIQAWQAWVKHV